jgi:hypothetical protein
MKYNVTKNGEVVKKNISKKQAEEYCEKMNQEFMDSQEKIRKQQHNAGLPLKKSKYELYKVEVVKENIIKLTESDLTKIITRIVKEHKFNVINKSDIDDAGTWSAEILTNRADGKFMYLMKDGKYVKIDKVPSKRYLSGMHNRHMANYIEYMTPETVESINDLLTQARDLERQAKELRRQAKEMID